jgi:EmrB/QacA subfamily drug resistance transporter
MTDQTATVTAGAPDRAADSRAGERSRWIALYVMCVGVLMIVLDATVVNVALPYIQRDLRFTQSSLAWVMNAYLIAFGGLLLLAGRLGDLLGRRRVFLVGLGVFTSASLVCGLAQSQEVLVAARFVQGVGGALTAAVVLGMIVTMFPQPADQAKAIGVYTFVASAGGSIGLLVGGVFTQAINWHWIFFVNVPIGVATAVLASRLLPADRPAGIAQGADVLGALLVTSSLMLGVYTIVEPAASEGWGATSTLLLGVLTLALLAAFLTREATARTPLVPLRMFRSRNVSAANAIQALTVAGMFGVFFLGSLYLHELLHYDALEIGLAFLPTTIVMGTLSLRYSQPLIMRFGARRALAPGLLLIAIGLALFTRAPIHGSYVTAVLPTILLLGAGVGVAFPALMTLAMSGATESDAGLASGLVNTTMQVGGAIGLAVLATLSATRSKHLLESGHARPEALLGGYHLAFLIGAALVLLALVIALTVLRPGAEAVAQEAPQTEAAAESALAGWEPVPEYVRDGEAA